MVGKIEKLLNKVQRFLDSGRRAQEKKRKKITQQLVPLRNRTKAIKRKLKSENDPEKREQLRGELELIKAKRKKAMQVLKEIRLGL